MFWRKLAVAPVPLEPPFSQTMTLSNLMFEMACAAVFESVSMCSSIRSWKASCEPPQAETISRRPSAFLARIS